MERAAGIVERVPIQVPTPERGAGSDGPRDSVALDVVGNEHAQRHPFPHRPDPGTVQHYIDIEQHGCPGHRTNSTGAAVRRDHSPPHLPRRRHSLDFTMDECQVVDLEEETSWPARLRDLAHDLAACEPDEFPRDEEIGGQVRGALEGYRVRAFHCTRLLDEEIEAIRTSGMRTLTRDLALGRLYTAATRGALAADEVETMKEGYDKAVGGWVEREGLLGFCLVATVLRACPHYFWRLLTFWGGEALYRAVEDDPLGEKLKTIGRPAIIVAHLDPLDFADWPDLTGIALACARQVRGDVDVDAGATVSIPVPSDAIENLVVSPSPRFSQLVPWMETK